MLATVVVIVIFGAALLFFVRECSREYSEEVSRRIQEDAERHEKWLERKRREVDERCKGKPLREQMRIHEEYCAMLEADIQRNQARVREIERQRKAAERAADARSEMPPDMKEAFVFLAGAAAVDSMKRKQGAGGGGSSGHRNKSHDCGCTCDACLEGRHEDCYDDYDDDCDDDCNDDCDLW